MRRNLKSLSYLLVLALLLTMFQTGCKRKNINLEPGKRAEHSEKAAETEAAETGAADLLQSKRGKIAKKTAAPASEETVSETGPASVITETSAAQPSSEATPTPEPTPTPGPTPEPTPTPTAEPTPTPEATPTPEPTPTPVPTPTPETTVTTAPLPESTDDVWKEIMGLKDKGLFDALIIKDHAGDLLLPSDPNDEQYLFSHMSEEKADKLQSSATDTITVAETGDDRVPLFNRLGRGYNVFGEYASEKYVRSAVLDLGRLIADRHIGVKTLDHYSNEQTIESSLERYVKSKSTEVGAGGGFLCFKAQVNLSFDKTQREESKNYFATIEQILQKYNPYIEPAVTYGEYVCDEAREDFLKLSAEDIVKKYSYYVLLTYIVGGKICYDVTNSSEHSATFQDFAIDVKASFNAAIASAGGDSKLKRSSSYEEFEENKTEKFYAKGGLQALPTGQQFKEDPAAIARWNQALETHGVMVSFATDDQALMPLWEIMRQMTWDDEASRKIVEEKAKALEQLYNKANSEFMGELPKEQHNSRRYLKSLILGMDYDDQKAALKASENGSRLVLTPDCNYKSGKLGEYKIYLGAEYGEPGDSSDAVTDLMISSDNDGESWECDAVHNGVENHYSLVLRSDYYDYLQTDMKQFEENFDAENCDLNDEAGGSFVYLYSSKDLVPGKKAPIYDLQVYYPGGGEYWKEEIPKVKAYAEENGYEVVCWLNKDEYANLNDYSGRALFLLFKRDYDAAAGGS